MKGWQRKRERESLVPFYLDALFTSRERERERGVSVSIIIECLDYQLDFRGVHGRAWWNRRTKEEKIRLGGDERAAGGGEGREEVVTIGGETRAIGGGEKRAEIFAATSRVDSRNSVKLETPLTGLDGRRAADS